MNRAIWLSLFLLLASCKQSDSVAEIGTKKEDPSAPDVSARAKDENAPKKGLPSEGEDAEQKFKESMALGDYPHVWYRDAQGNAISFEEFMRQVSEEKKTFGMLKISDPKTAILSVNAPGKRESEAKDGIRIGSRLPTFGKVRTLDGKSVDDDTFSGRYTLLSFFFSDCLPCITEVPVLNAYAEAHPEMGVLAVTYDDAEQARAFVSKRGLEWPVLADSETYIKKVGVKTYPTMLLIGPDRKIVAKMKTTLLQREDDTASAVAALEAWIRSQQ